MQALCQVSKQYLFSADILESWHENCRGEGCVVQSDWVIYCYGLITEEPKNYLIHYSNNNTLIIGFFSHISLSFPPNLISVGYTS